jgi:hypothetical protein
MVRDAVRREQRPKLVHVVDLVTLFAFLEGGTKGSCSGWRAFVETRRCVFALPCGTQPMW